MISFFSCKCLPLKIETGYWILASFNVVQNKKIFYLSALQNTVFINPKYVKFLVGAPWVTEPKLIFFKMCFIKKKIFILKASFLQIKPTEKFTFRRRSGAQEICPQERVIYRMRKEDTHQKKKKFNFFILFAKRHKERFFMCIFGGRLQHLF
jgi:hypothetical protein